jgi:hypothetical protein
MTEQLVGGAWGIRMPAVSGVAHLMSEVPSTWPLVKVTTEVSHEVSREIEWGPERAQYTLLGGHHVRIEREPLRVHLQLCRPTTPEGIVAPHLSSAASTIAIWRGDEPFHAGAFVHGGGAWALLGAKGSGKTSTLAMLNRLGVAVLTDDLLIYQEGRVLVGPRCVDLRREPAQALAVGKDIGIVGTRRRWRVYLPRCPVSVPLAGWLLPEWGDSDSLTRLEPADRLRVLPQFRALRVPWERPDSLLELATLPFYRWRRPRLLHKLDASVSNLLSSLAADC